jgi:two-component system CheB/CheR fusion protein
MVNTPLSKIIGAPFESFILPDCKEQFQQLFAKGWIEDCKKETILYNNGQITPCQLSLATLDLVEGISLSIIITDLTAQKEAQTQLTEKNILLENLNHELEASNNDLQQFALVASHDLQEPLRKILMFSSLIQGEHSHELTALPTAYIQKIISSAERMKTLIIDILTFSRLSSADNFFEVTDLNVLVAKLLEDFELSIKEKNATIKVGELPVIEVIPGLIRQVFQNIISNALKFSKKDLAPVVNIHTCRASLPGIKDPAWQITIQDNGIGFDQKYVAGLFTIFSRLHSKDRFEGTGVGLAITKKIIEKHNGIITAVSEEDKGAAFIITLPEHQQR